MEKKFISVGSFAVNADELLYFGVDDSEKTIIKFQYKNGHTHKIEFLDIEETQKMLSHLGECLCFDIEDSSDETEETEEEQEETDDEE